MLARVYLNRTSQPKEIRSIDFLSWSKGLMRDVMIELFNISYKAVNLFSNDLQTLLSAANLTFSSLLSLAPSREVL